MPNKTTFSYDPELVSQFRMFAIVMPSGNELYHYRTTPRSKQLVNPDAEEKSQYEDTASEYRIGKINELAAVASYAEANDIPLFECLELAKKGEL
jgi:hypothetical protein